MRKTYLLMLSMASILIMSACSGAASSSPTGDWKLVSYGDTSNPRAAMPDVDAVVSFDGDGQFGGNVGCNSFGGDYKVDGHQITFGSIVSTMMFCTETSDQETTVLGILTDKTVNFQIDGELLTITSTDGASAIVLARK